MSREKAITEDVKYKVLVGIDTGRAKPSTAAIFEKTYFCDFY